MESLILNFRMKVDLSMQLELSLQRLRLEVVLTEKDSKK